MKNLLLSCLSLLLPILATAQQTGPELISAAIKYHDPEGNWPQTQATFLFVDTRPGKEDRAATLYLNNPEGILCFMREQDGRQVTRHVVHEECSYDIDGHPPTAAATGQYQLNHKRTLMLRNYYLYLWGLPMKLTDAGTIVDDKIYQKEFNGRQTLAARVTYDAGVGNDIWYFYFDPATYEMVGYQFFHDEAKGDGEYILLSGMVAVNGMKIPQSRTWYTNPDSTLLGTDNLVAIKPLAHKH